MYRTYFKLVAGVLLSAVIGDAAVAQGTLAQQNACRGDVFRLCAGSVPDVGRSLPAYGAMNRGSAMRVTPLCSKHRRL